MKIFILLFFFVAIEPAMTDCNSDCAGGGFPSGGMCVVGACTPPIFNPGGWATCFDGSETCCCNPF